MLLISCRIDFHAIFSIRICFCRILFVWKYKRTHGFQRNSFVAQIFIHGIWLHYGLPVAIVTGFNHDSLKYNLWTNSWNASVEGCVNTAAYVRKIRMNVGIIYPFISSLYSHWRYGIPMLKFCVILSDVGSLIWGKVREEEQLFVCICYVVFTRRLRPSRSQNGVGLWH